MVPSNRLTVPSIDSTNTVLCVEFATSWQIDGETMETVRDFIFLVSNITADGDCSHEMKRHSLEEKLWPT